MEIANINNENSFDLTPKLKSSPIPIFFNKYDKSCIVCGEEYIQTIICEQNIAKNVYYRYLTNITDSNLSLDVYLFTKDLIGI
jgi:hypothetical protein